MQFNNVIARAHTYNNMYNSVHACTVKLSVLICLSATPTSGHLLSAHEHNWPGMACKIINRYIQLSSLCRCRWMPDADTEHAWCSREL